MWTVEFLPKAIEEEAELPLDMKANLGRMTKVIGERVFWIFRRAG